MQKLGDKLTAEQRKKLGALGPGETRREQLWKESVAQAKQYVKMSDELRFKIIALAEKCCYDGEGSIYTFNRFADEIGLARSTMAEWIRVKRSVYDSLPKEEQDFLSFTQMRTLGKMTAGISGIKTKKKAVLQALAHMKKAHPDTLKFQRYLLQMKTVLYNTKDKHRTKKCDREVLAEMLHVSRAISNSLVWVDFEVKKK